MITSAAYHYLLLIVLLLSLPVSAFAQSDSTFIFKGEIKGVDSGIVYLTYNGINKAIRDSCTVHFGQFQFTGKITHPTLTSFSLQSKNLPSQSLSFYLEPTLIKAHFEAKHLDTKGISGSQTQDERVLLQQMLQQGDSDDRWEIAKNFIRQHPNSYVSLARLAIAHHRLPADTIVALFHRISHQYLESSYGKQLEQIVDRTQHIRKGKPAPPFVLPDSTGELHSLKDFWGQYVLLDFWASWCSPCLRNAPYLKKLQNSTSLKNLKIIGISLDTDSAQWLKAIKTHQLDWLQLWNLSEHHPIANKYYAQLIPAYFLIDPQGNICLSDIKGSDLVKKVSRILTP